MGKKKNNRFSVLITTALIIGCTMAVYYFYTNKVKTQRINQQAYHLLHRKAKDLVQLEVANMNISKASCYQNIFSDYSFSTREDFKELILNDLQTKEIISYAKDSVSFKIVATEDIGSSYWHAQALSLDDFITDLNFPSSFFNNYAIVSDQDLYFSKDQEFSLQLETTDASSFFELKRKRMQQLKKDSIPISFDFNLDALDSINGKSYSISSKEKQLEVISRGISYQAFIVPVNSDNNGGAQFLVGFIKTSDYNIMRQGLNYQLTLAILILVIALLLSIPLIKLLVVSPGESYGKTNLIVLIANICFILFFALFIFIRYYKQTDLNHQLIGRNGQIEQISEQLKTQFNHELDSMVTLLYQLKNDSIPFVTIEEGNKIPNGYWPMLDFKTYPYIEACFETDKMGIVTNILSTTTPINAGIDVSKREYFQYPQKFSILNDSIRFGFQSIFDLLTGTPEADISTKKSDGSVIALSTHMFSVSHTVLPDGYAFCIMDKDGKVWFHKDPFNNARENFMDEISEKPLVQEAIQSRRAKAFITEYKLIPHYMYIQPLRPEMDLYVVSMCSKKMYDKNGSYLGSAIIGAYLGTIFLFLISAILGIAAYNIIQRHKRMTHPKAGASLSVLSFFPTRSNLKQYGVATLVNILVLGVVIGLLAGKVYRTYDFPVLVITLVISAVSVLFWYTLQLAPQKSTSLYIIIRRVIIRYIVIAIYTCIPFLWLCCSGSMYAENIWLPLLIYPLALNLFFPILYLLVNALVPVLKGFSDKVRPTLELYWQEIYSIGIFSISLWWVVLPFLTFFLYFHYYESTIFTNRQLTLVAKSMEQRENKIRERLMLENEDLRTYLDWETQERTNNYRTFAIDSFGSFNAFILQNYNNDTTLKQRLEKGQYFPASFQFSEIDSIPVKVRYHENIMNYVNRFGSLRNYHHYLRDKLEYGLSKANVNYVTTTDTLFRYSSVTVAKDLNQVYIQRSNNGKINTAGSKSFKMQKPATLLQHTVLVGFPIGVLLIFILYLWVSRKLYWHIFPEFKYDSNYIRAYRELNQITTNQPNRIYYVTMPDVEYLKNKFECELDQPLLITDILSVPDMDDDETRPIILSIPYFVKIGKIEMQYILGKLLKWTESPQHILYFVSLITPIDFIRFLRNQSKEPDWQQHINRLENLLFQCSLFYIPVNKQTTDKKGEKVNFHLNSQHQTALNQTIESALKMQTMNDNTSDNDYVRYATAYPYYQQIWNACTLIEKSVLYDIAEDYVINLHNKKEIGILINKGLVDNGPFLQLFNSGFRRFVLKQKQEVNELNDELKDQYQGGWSIVRIPVIIITLAIVLFIVTTQQNFLNNVQSILLSLGTIITIGLRFIQIPWSTKKDET